MCQCAGGSYCRAIARPGGSSSGFPSFHCCFPAQGIKNCPCTELSSVQGQEKILWCHLAYRGHTAATLREANTSLPGNGGCRLRILRPCRFPAPSANHLSAPLSAPFPATGALCGCACSFTFASSV